MLLVKQANLLCTLTSVESVNTRNRSSKQQAQQQESLSLIFPGLECASSQHPAFLGISWKTRDQARGSDCCIAHQDRCKQTCGCQVSTGKQMSVLILSWESVSHTPGESRNRHLLSDYACPIAQPLFYHMSMDIHRVDGSSLKDTFWLHWRQNLLPKFQHLILICHGLCW